MDRNKPTTIVIPMRNGLGAFVIDPDVVAGDVQISLDGGAFANVATAPVVRAGTALVEIALTAAETDAVEIVIRFLDADGNGNWSEVLVTENPSTVLSEVRKTPRGDTEREGGDAWRVNGSNYNTIAVGEREYDRTLG